MPRVELPSTRHIAKAVKRIQHAQDADVARGVAMGLFLHEATVEAIRVVTLNQVEEVL